MSHPRPIVGGPLALIRTGDIIELDVPNRTLNVAVPDEEMETRRGSLDSARKPRYERGYGRMFTKHIEQADKGCDFDFLRTDFGGPVPEPEIH